MHYYSTMEKDLAVVTFYFGSPTTMGGWCVGVGHD